MCECVCVVCVSVRACVRACVRAWVSACVRACVFVCVKKTFKEICVLKKSVFDVLQHIYQPISNWPATNRRNRPTGIRIVDLCEL